MQVIFILANTIIVSCSLHGARDAPEVFIFKNTKSFYISNIFIQVYLKLETHFT